MQGLPIDTQKEIISFLDGSAVLSLAQVNRHFRDLIAKNENFQAGIIFQLLSKQMKSYFPNSLSAVHNLEDWIKHRLIFSHTTSEKSPQVCTYVWRRMKKIWKDDTLSQRKHLWKVIVIGESSVGKTSLLHMFVEKKMRPAYKGTMGWDFLTKEILINKQSNILQLWDTAGQERFQGLGTSFYRGTDVVIITYDVMSLKAFHALETWIEEIQLQIPNVFESASVILCGNKLDLVNTPGSSTSSSSPIEPVPSGKIEALSAKWHLPWIHTSAKDNTNVEALFMAAATLHLMKLEANSIMDTVDINILRVGEPTTSYLSPCYC